MYHANNVTTSTSCYKELCLCLVEYIYALYVKAPNFDRPSIHLNGLGLGMEVQNIYKYSILCLVSECPKVANMTWINSYNFNCNHICISIIYISTVLL